MQHKTGYLLLNLGTPASTDVQDVRSYLNEFLMDPYVLQLPWPIRRLIVSLFILPLRPKNSAHAYAQIWTEEGSPLLVQSQQLANAVGKHAAVPTALAMRYGEPSISVAVQALLDQDVDHIVIAPLYPQFAQSTVTTSINAARKAIGKRATTAVLPPFFDQPTYITTLAEHVRAHLPDQWDHLLLSYHSLPEAHLTKADPTGEFCLKNPTCCLPKSAPNKAHEAHDTCYRHQAYTTSRLLARELGLMNDTYTISFQSRLGRTPWLQPYTDDTLTALPKQGIKRLVVLCPAFIADNLETLEEINLQGRETFQAAGGESFHLVPCLNASRPWVDTLCQLLADVDQTLIATG